MHPLAVRSEKDFVTQLANRKGVGVILRKDGHLFVHAANLVKQVPAGEDAAAATVLQLHWTGKGWVFLPVIDMPPATLSGDADFAVGGQTDPELIAIPIAWDGIAVLVDFANPVREITFPQLAAMFSGSITRWSDMGGTDNPIELIDRPSNAHVRGTFETVLGIVGRIPLSASMRRSDQRAISSVAGNGSAVTYASLGVALDAVTYGVGVALLSIDNVEPAKQTVKDGRYRLRRPVLLLRKHASNPTAESFARFALSQEGQDIVEDMFVPFTGSDPGFRSVGSSEQHSR